MNFPLSSALVLKHVEHTPLRLSNRCFFLLAPNVSGEKELVGLLGRFPSLSSPYLTFANTPNFGILIPPLLSLISVANQRQQQHSAHPSTAEVPSIPGAGLATPALGISGVAGGFLGGSSATPWRAWVAFMGHRRVDHQWVTIGHGFTRVKNQQ